MEFSYPAAQQSFLASVCFHDENCSNFCKQKFFSTSHSSVRSHHVYEKSMGLLYVAKCTWRINLVFSWSKNKLSFCCKRHIKVLWKEALFFEWASAWFVRGKKGCPFAVKTAFFFLLRTYGCSCGRVTSPYEEMFKIRTVQDTGCSGGIRTHGLRVMSPASDQAALRCDKIESTELLHPDKSFTINGGFEHPSIQYSLGFCLLFTPSGFWLVIFTLFPKRHFLYRYKPCKLSHR